MTTGKSIPSVSVTDAQNGRSTRSNELGLRLMQERTWAKRGDFPRRPDCATFRPDRN